MLQALIFDVDGTLAETEEVHRAAFNQAFREAGLDWSWDRRLYGELLAVTGGKERIRHFMASRGKPTYTSSLADTDMLIAMLHRRKTALYGEMIGRGEVTLRPGIAELIAAARAGGVRLAIATTTSRPNVDALLDATLGADAPSTFEVIVAGDEVGAKKPAPDVYVAALKLLGLGSEACLALEDSANGVRSACGAGLGVVVTKGMYTQGDCFDGALCVLDDLHGLTGGAAAGGGSLLAALCDLRSSRAAGIGVQRAGRG
jgi:HAD superfamily hydrolase (TIGR01509 family)